MRRSTIIGCFVGLLSLTMSAQSTKSNTSKSETGTTNIEVQKRPAASIQELLTRYQNIGSNSGSLSEYFSKEEQQMLHSYFSNQQSAKKASVVKKAGENKKLTTKVESALSNSQFTPLFIEFANNPNSSRNVQLPAAYTNGSVSAITETTGLNSNVSQDFNRNVPFTGTYYFQSPNAIVYDNGPYYNVAGTPDVSLLEDTSLGMGTYGSGAQFTAGNSIADDVVLTDDYDISSIDVFAYQTGSTAPSLTAVYLQVWDGDPSGGGASVIWGDLTTNILAAAAGTNAFRQLESAPGATNREIQRATANTTGLSLTAGTYWIEYTFEGSGASGPWAPPIAILGASTTGNSLQNQAGVWVPLVDVGPQGMPFVMYGDLVGGGGTACSQDNPSNNFENGFTSSNNTPQIIAADIIVDADTNLNLDSIIANWLVFDGEVIVSADITIYGDLGGLPDPSNVLATIPGIVPTSQPIIGDFPANPILDVLELNFDISPVMLNGQAGVATTYWISIYADNTTASNSFWEFSTATVVGNDGAFSPDNGVTWGVALPGSDQVYEFSGDCQPIGGGGGVLDTAYGVNNSNVELIGFPVSDPSTVEVFGDSPVTVNFENAGAIDPANPTTGYALDNGGQFYSFDVASGFYTLLGNIPGDWVGMEFDQASDVLYAIAGADLYTIDPVAVSATLVGATGISPGDLPIALAIDGAGVGYTYDLVTDNLYSIDLTTATATLIGNIGFDANFGQGMCYDALTDTVYMAAFNSGSFAGEWRSVNIATGATTLLGPIVTTAATTQVAWVSIGETLPPPACPEPTNLMVTNVGPTSADLSWTVEPNATSGYIWYVFDQGANPVTDTPVATGTTPAGTTTATATGLAGGFSYDFYVVADCNSDGLSQYAGPITFATPPACGGKFYDTGGAGGDYQNGENITTIISPENAGELVTVTFTAFEVEATWDALYVYDGPDASFPIISSGNPPTNSGFPAGGYYGTSIPGPFVSTDPSGALTFVFMSDASVPQSGWEADVTCALSPPPNDLIVNSIDVDEIGFPYTDPAVHMPAATTEGGNPVNCDLTGANGVWYNFVPAGDGTATAMIVTPGGASSVTFYTAPDENAVETDLTLVPQQTNQCAPGTSASIFTLGGQAYYVFVMNTGAITDIVIDGT
ncbi:MAG: hypothetical protein V7655_16190, partial [Aequorivita antarctica]